MMMYSRRNKIKKIQTSSSSDHQSAAFIVGSNDDLLTEILLRLPVTSILQFKSVSKQWLHLLSHASFTLRYDSLPKSPGFFAGNEYVPFDDEDPNDPPLYNLNFFFNRSDLKIVQSCNGLLLICGDFYDRYNTRSHEYYVFNPTTKQFATIPPVPGGPNVRKTICFMGLAFHQTRYVHYKVVCVRMIDTRGKLYRIMIYSSDTRKWSVSIENFSAEMLSFRDEGVYWNGAMHWTPYCRSHMYFNIDSERMQSLPLPGEMMLGFKTYFGEYTTYFGESRGHLHLIVTSDQFQMNVYEMLSDYSGWFVKYRVELDENDFESLALTHRRCLKLDVLDVVRGEKEEDTFLVLVAPWGIMAYNVHDKSLKHLFMFNYSVDFFIGISKYHRYTEALTSF